MRLMLKFVLLLALLPACHEKIVGPPRDWAQHPAFVEVFPTKAPLWALSDVHGGYDRLVALLRGNGILDAGLHWSGGQGTLLVVGDLIDKANRGLPVLDLLMALEGEAAAAGGRVVVCMGNHEAEFLADPWTGKAKPFSAELRSRGIEPGDVARGQPPYGPWLRNLPFGVRSGDWFFAHAGNTAGLTIEALAARIQGGVDRDDFATDALIGSDSVLESQKWWEGGFADAVDPLSVVRQNLSALGVQHIVFGHDPGAFHPSGVISARFGATLLRIDTGRSPAVNLSEGALLLLDRSSGKSVASARLPNGNSTELYRDP